MRLTTLSDNVLLIERHMIASKTLLRESCDGLTVSQRTIVEGIYNEFVPLIEATLTADQIKQVFGELEKQSIAGKQNRTMAGAGVDVAREANKVINNMGKWLQDTAPVKAFDQKFENLKAKVAAKFPDIADKLEGLGELAKANPGKTAAVVGILTALAALAGGPVGGAVAGQVLRGAVELLKGEKLSTAIGKGVKTAVFGYLTGAALQKVGDMISGVVAKCVPNPGNPDIVNGTFDYTEVVGNTKITNYAKGSFFKADADALDQAGSIFQTAVDPADKAEAWAQYVDLMKKVSTPEYTKQIQQATTQYLDNSGLYQAAQNVTQALAAAGQGAEAGAGVAGQGQPQESLYVQDRPLSEGQVYLVFNRVLSEAGFADKAKELGSKALGAVAKGASWAGKQATEKVTSAKLLAAWKMEGSPTDSEQFKQFLLNYGGIDQAVIDKVFADLRIGTTAEAPVTYDDVAANIQKLDKKGRQRIMAYLQRQKGTV